ncbi:exodeoxyribonuclease V subunit alpha [Vibrio gangliei]|uniref:exodeoxyribonuclease V subunit alpha n=1 Tax=Vibrio gangliei TaxID=2077090 RepID=UPI000D0151F3|nr:exodeoxyribonuclease V subunit alpha [Vibrio gangliei]
MNSLNIHDREHPSQTLACLQQLEKLGVIRAIDVQFAWFIHQQVSSHYSGDMALLACLLSSELGRGHICLNLEQLEVEHALSLGFLLRQHAEKLSPFSALLDAWAQKNWLETAQQYAKQDDSIVAHQALDHNSPLAPLPMTLEGNRLYLTRYWYYEQQVAKGLAERAKTLPMTSTSIQAAKATLDNLFARDYTYLWQALQTGQYHHLAQRQCLVCEMLDVEETDQLDWPRIDQALMSAETVADLAQLDELVPMSVCLNWQKVAASVALTRQFAVISGGPGTGKTTTVAKLLAAFIVQAQQEAVGQAAPVIKLVAPTGKAAARLTESIGLAIAQLPVSDEVKALMPAQSSTIHRLLGARPNTVEYKHHRGNPLHLDILVVDEASMVDLPMMFRLLQALPKQARLILLGDKDQLASVEAGAILGDLCQFSSIGYQPEFHQLLTKMTGFQTLPKVASKSQGLRVADSLCMLQKSYRFHARSGVGQLAKAINSGKSQEVEQVWQQGFADIQLHSIPSRLEMGHGANIQDTHTAIARMMEQAYQPYCALLPSHTKSQTTQLASMTVVEMEQKARTILHAFSRARLLCAVREGEFGVERMNQLIEKTLSANHSIDPQENVNWYIGRPVMVTQNDSAQGLHNGDIGICLQDQSDDDGHYRVYFEMPDGRIKGVLPSRVPQHELAFAMTIHKSQGSEFSHTVMVLPNQMNQILTRELIYTGVTRAKDKLDLFANPSILAQGVGIKTLRSSGLSEKL